MSCVLVVEALRARLGAYPDIRARHAFLSSATIPSHQSTLHRLHQVLNTLHTDSDTEVSSHPSQSHPLSHSTLQSNLATYHTAHSTTQHSLQAQHATLTHSLTTLSSHLTAASHITHREAAADGTLSVVGSMHPSELVELLGVVSDAVDAVGERCNSVLAEEEKVRRMKQAARGRRWNETAVMYAMLKQPNELRRAEAELKRRLGRDDEAHQ